MIAEQTFDERMARLSDEELYDVLANEADYLPEAIAAAKQEIQNRNLSSEKLAEFERDMAFYFILPSSFCRCFE